MVDDPNADWAALLSGWAVPDDLRAAAPASPYFFDPKVFIEAADSALARNFDTPSDRAAREALAPAGSVLDVGVGAGAASLRLTAARLIGVDISGELLAAFAERAAQRGMAATTIEGRWPDVAGRTPPADVVVCHHVVYNVADLAAFASALFEHARARVVVELTVDHPMAWMAPYWEAIHRLAQPDRPTVDDTIKVLNALGFDVHEQRWMRDVQMIGESGGEQLARIARRLCLPASRHDELLRALSETPPPRERAVATLWWDRR